MWVVIFCTIRSIYMQFLIIKVIYMYLKIWIYRNVVVIFSNLFMHNLYGGMLFTYLFIV